MEAIQNSWRFLKGSIQIDIVAFKGFLGHCLSASGIVEFILGL